MKQLLLCILSAVMLGACTNNGDIGHLYGMWALDAATVDGEPDANINPEEFYWGFQNNIIIVQHQLPGHNFAPDNGTWRLLDNDSRMELNFTYNIATQNKTTVATVAMLGLSTQKVNTLDVQKLTDTRMTLSMVTDTGETRTYRLRKLR